MYAIRKNAIPATKSITKNNKNNGKYAVTPTLVLTLSLTLALTLSCIYPSLIFGIATFGIASCYHDTQQQPGVYITIFEGKVFQMKSERLCIRFFGDSLLMARQICCM